MKRSSATLERSPLAERRQFRWATSEHVVYAYRHGASPAITYHSVPHACAGGAATLDEARKSYRSSMAEKLGVGQRKLPPVVEHLEAVVAGMWVRDKIGAVRRAAADDRMLLQACLLTDRSNRSALTSSAQPVAGQRRSLSSSNPTTPSAPCWIKCVPKTSSSLSIAMRR